MILLLLLLLTACRSAPITLGSTATCSTITVIDAGSEAAQALAEGARQNRFIEENGGAPDPNAPPATFLWGREFEGWALASIRFEPNYAPSIFAFRQEGGTYEFVDTVWSGGAALEADIQQQLQAALPDAPATLIECVPVESYLN